MKYENKKEVDKLCAQIKSLEEELDGVRTCTEVHLVHRNYTECVVAINNELAPDTYKLIVAKQVAAEKYKEEIIVELLQAIADLKAELKKL